MKALKFPAIGFVALINAGTEDQFHTFCHSEVSAVKEAEGNIGEVVTVAEYRLVKTTRLRRIEEAVKA